MTASTRSAIAQHVSTPMPTAPRLATHETAPCMPLIALARAACWRRCVCADLTRSSSTASSAIRAAASCTATAASLTASVALARSAALDPFAAAARAVAAALRATSPPPLLLGERDSASSWALSAAACFAVACSTAARAVLTTLLDACRRACACRCAAVAAEL